METKTMTSGKTEIETINKELELVNRAWSLLSDEVITNHFCNVDWYNMRDYVLHFRDALLRKREQLKEAQN